MNIKRIITIQVILTLIFSISLFFVFDYRVSLGIILGSSLGFFNFYSLNKRISELIDEELADMRKIIKGNRNFRYLVLILVLLVSGFLPQLFNIIAVCFSILINKISIYINLMIDKIRGKEEA